MKKCEFLGLAVLLVSAFSGCATRDARSPVILSAQEAGGPATLRSRGMEERPPQMEQSPVISPVTGAEVTNAADFYREAMTLYDAMPSDGRMALMSWQEEMDAEKERELCEKVAPILDFMRAAAALTNCDWGVPQAGQGANYVFGPYLHKCRDLGWATIWSAAHCHQEDATGFVDDLVLGLQFITHRVRQDFLMCFLVTASVHSRAAICIAENATRLSEPDRARLLQALNDPQFEENLYLAIEEDASRVLEQAAIDESNMTAVVAQPPADSLATLKAMREAAELQKEFAAALNQSESQYQAWLDKARVVQTTNPYIERQREQLEMVVNQGRAARVRQAMVEAGMAVLQSGPSALSNHPDPATGKPFGYQENADEFQLESGFQVRGEPVTLTFHRGSSSGK